MEEQTLEERKDSKETLVSFLETDVRDIEIDLNNITNSFIYSIPEIETIFTPSKFGMDWQYIDYYKNRIPAGLIEQFPCLYYLLVDYWKEATSRTPLEELELRTGIYES